MSSKRTRGDYSTGARPPAPDLRRPFAMQGSLASMGLTGGRQEGRRCYDATTKGVNAVSDSRSELKLNYDDYLSFPDDGKRREIIDGELFVTPVLAHVRPTANRRMV